MNAKESLDEYARYKFVVENIEDVLWEANAGAVFTFLSPAVREMTGYDAAQMLGRSALEFLAEDSKRYIQEQLHKSAGHEAAGQFGRSFLYDMEFIRADGSTIWCEVSVKPVYRDNSLVCYIGTARDVSERKMVEKKLQEMLEGQMRISAQLEDMATFDMLTGAYNRRKFKYFIEREIDKAEKYGTPFSIGMLDIDNFKQVNDVSGHNKGDHVLKDIVALIKNTLRATDRLFRWGGDEFIILFPDLNTENAMKVANRIRERIQANIFDTEGKGITVSLGIGAYEAKETADQFVARVDKALLNAKNKGKNLAEIA